MIMAVSGDGVRSEPFAARKVAAVRGVRSIRASTYPPGGASVGEPWSDHGVLAITLLVLLAAAAQLDPHNVR